jgi:hypothetical protein
MIRMPRASAFGLALIAFVGLTRAAPPRVEADPSKQYALTPQSGLWLICAAHYGGDDAAEFARQMVNWVRAHGFAAYAYNRGAEERQRANEEERRKAAAFPDYRPLIAVTAEEADAMERSPHPPTTGVMRPRYTRVQEQCVVLIGGYPDPDAANAALKQVRKLPMPDIKLPSGLPAFDHLMGDARTPEGKTIQGEVTVNPFQTAFVTRNPLVAQAPKPKFDPAWARLNSREEYSIFKCPRPWTLAVRQYAGMLTAAPAEASGGIFDKMFGGKKEGEMLNAAAYNAHELARTLRRLNFDAYVLHTRTTSVVTVGGFDSPTSPEVNRLKQRLAALQAQVIATSKQDPFGFLPYPQPMEVPHE